jgi:hypothetical protein
MLYIPLAEGRLSLRAIEYICICSVPHKLERRICGVVEPTMSISAWDSYTFAQKMRRFFGRQVFPSADWILPVGPATLG